MRLRPHAFVAFLVVLAGCGSAAPNAALSGPTRSPGQPVPGLTAGASVPGALASPGTASTFPPATATTGPSSEPIATVRFPFADREMEVAIVGQPGIVVAWRGATDGELDAIRWDESADVGLGQLSDREVVLGWIGTICDLEATLIVGPGSLVVSPQPRPACDAMAVGRGMVLTFAASVDPADIEVRLLDTVLLPASS
jgi:hypothetical protein